MSSIDPRSRENRPRRGRPSKGDRVSLRVRVPRNLAVLFLQDATRAGISQSDQMAQILATYYVSSCRDQSLVPALGSQSSTRSGP
jgi:hypothetical protein